MRPFAKFFGMHGCDAQALGDDDLTTEESPSNASETHQRVFPRTPTLFGTAISAACAPVPGHVTPGRHSCMRPPVELCLVSDVHNMGPREALSTLTEEFKFNATFAEKVRRLEHQGYTGWRRIRGDGNCYYRSVGFGLLEQLVVAVGPQRLAYASTLHSRLAALQFDNSAVSAAHETLLARIGRLQHGAGWEELDRGSAEMTASGLLYRSLRDSRNGSDMALIRALRKLTASYITSHAHDVTANHGISFHDVCACAGEFEGVVDFCNKVVLPDGVDAETICQQALPAALGIGVRIAFLDRRDAKDVSFHDFGPVASDEISSAEAHGGLDLQERPLVHIQLRPGHYDLLYFRGAADLSAATPTLLHPDMQRTQPSQSVPSASLPRREVVIGEAATRQAGSRAPRPPTLGSEDFGEFELLASQKPGQEGPASARCRDRGGMCL